MKNLIKLIVLLVVVCTSSTVYAAWPGQCYKVLSKFAGTASSDRYNSTVTFNAGTGALALPDYPWFQNTSSVDQYDIWSFYWDAASSKWVQQSVVHARFKTGTGVALIGNIGGTIVASITDLESQFPGCSNCNDADTDGDGVCDECDKVPGANDPQDCILGEAVGSDGSLSGIVIDEGCTNIQENFVYWGSDKFTTQDRWMWHIGNSAEQLGRKTCHPGAAAGECCAYSEGSLGAQKTVGLAEAGPMPSPTVDSMVASLTDLPNPDDLPSNCSGHHAQCEKMCSSKLGVAFQYCREDPITHATESDCKCNTDFQYKMATPQDTAKNPTDNKYDVDSNGNAVPDYADDSLLHEGDTDGDHITNKADVDSTGGPDSNKDGIDDNYQVTAKAIAQAGLSAADSSNLHDIENNTANTVASVNNLGTRIGQILDKMTEDEIKNQAFRDKIGTALDSFNTGNTTPVEGADEGTFTGIGTDLMPIDESEDFDVDEFISQFNYMEEFKDAVQNSRVETSSSGSCVEGNIRGSHVKFCFSMFETWFLLMGQILKAMATFKGFDIVVTGGRGFGG